MSDSRKNPPSDSYSSPNSDTTGRPTGSIPPEEEQPPQPITYTARPRVIVKFKDNDQTLAPEFAASDLLAKVSVDAAKRANGIMFRPHFNATTLDRVNKRFKKVTDKNPVTEGPNLEAYRKAEVKDKKQGRQLVRDLRSLDNVQHAYLHPGPVTPPVVDSSNDELAVLQGYLDPAPLGVDARYAWTLAGGDGENQRLADIEWGWNLQHVDLVGHNFTNIATGFHQSLPHGTNVLGVIAARDNDTLCVGITPNLGSIVTVGQWRSDKEYVTEEAILDAIFELNAGDVLLLEVQTDMFGYTNIPAEAEPAVFDMVWLATALDIVVVAAAGNGGIDLDTLEDNSNVRIFDQTVQDSGAIIVGSAWPEGDPPRQRRCDSCYGNRVDCFAWGGEVVTLSTNYDGNNDGAWSDHFTATSAASAIVAGAALALQGVTQKRYGGRWGAYGMRQWLSSTYLNTPSANFGNDRIGVMPDLCRIIKELP